MELVRLTARDFDEAMDFLDLVFSSAYCPFHFAKMLPSIYQPTDEAMRCNFAVRENGRIRAIVGAFPAEIRAGDDTLTWHGIGGVSAHRNDRGRGWMKILMERALQEMADTNTDLSFLTGLRQRYQYFGYEKVGALPEYRILGTNLRHAFAGVDAPALQFVPIGADDAALEQARRLYEAQPFYMVRGGEMFHRCLISLDAAPWAILHADGTMLGYLTANAKGDKITELFAEASADYAAIIRAWVDAKQVETVTVQLAPWQLTAARQFGDFVEDFRLSDNGNWRIFHWDRVTAALLHVKQNMQPLPDGDLSLGIKDYGTLEIHVRGTEITCRRSDATPAVTLNAFHAARFLFGAMPTVFVQDIPKNVRALTDAWFPLPLAWLPQNYV